MKIIEIYKDLVIKGIYSATLTYDLTYDQFYIDLATQSKSDLYLYENGVLRGRYNYENTLNLEDEDLFKTLLKEYEQSKHGRDFGNPEWEKYLNSVN